MPSDCKDSINFQENQYKWEKEKKIRNQCWEEDKLGLKGEKQKCLSTQCACPKKTSKKDYKITGETKYEKKNFNIFKNCSNPLNTFCANWNNNKIKKSNAFEDFRCNENLNCDKILAQTISELNEKVEFLFKIFQDFGPKILSDSHNKQPYSNYSVVSDPGDFWQLFNISKRLSVAEKGIQKLTLILEELLRDSSKRKACFPNESLIFNEPLDFEQMTIPQRINLLKTRNDFLFTFMRDFLKVRSVDELHSTLDFFPKYYESNQIPLKPTFHFIQENNTTDFDGKNIIETLKELRMQFTQVNEDASQNSNENQPTIREKKGESAAKCCGNKLEVISEQAEFALYYDNKHEDSNELKKKNIRHLKGKFSEVNQEYKEKDSTISEITARILAQEAVLKSSLDKTHFENFSKRNTSESENFTFNQNHQRNLKIETPTEEENNEGGTETSLDSSSCIYCETEKSEKSKVNDKNTRKCSIHEEYKEQKLKQERNAEYMSNLPKPNTIFSKKTNSWKLSDTRNNFSLREETKSDTGAKNQRRPMTTPVTHSKTLPTSGCKTPPRVLKNPDKNKEKYSRTNTVKNKNKFLLSQKSCAQTA